MILTLREMSGQCDHGRKQLTCNRNANFATQRTADADGKAGRRDEAIADLTENSVNYGEASDYSTSRGDGT